VRKKHRANGEGTVFKRPAGGWQAQATIGGKRRSFYGRTQAATLDKVKAARTAVEAGSLTAEPNLTVGEYLARWIEGRRGTVEFSTWADTKQVLGSHVTPAIGPMRLRDLKPHHVDAMLAQAGRVGGGRLLSPRTRKRIRTALVLALHDAERDELVLRNAAQLSRPIPQTAQEVKPFSPADAMKLVAAAEASENGAPFLLGLIPGMREGEILGLLWENLDLDAGILRVRTHLKREAGRFVLGDLKTHGRSAPVLGLPNRLIDVLRRHRARQAVLRERAGSAWRPTWDLVFTTERGTPIEKTNFIRRQWRPFLRAAGVEYRPFHTTRHTAATVADTHDVPLSEISRTLGHSSERSTTEIYKHTFAPLRSVAPQAVADALFPPQDAGGVGGPAPGFEHGVDRLARKHPTPAEAHRR
jgi:integrase